MPGQDQQLDVDDEMAVKSDISRSSKTQTMNYAQTERLYFPSLLVRY